MRMEVNLIGEYGLEQGLFGLGLSYGKTSGMTFEEFQNDKELKRKMLDVAKKLFWKDGGHNKYLEFPVLYIDVNAPVFWWIEADTYRIATKQSESTMHTLVGCFDELHEGIIQAGKESGHRGIVDYVRQHFDYESEECVEPLACWLEQIMNLACGKDAITKLLTEKQLLPTGFMQRRIWKLEIKSFVNIYKQRKNHKLPHWKYFIQNIVDSSENIRILTAPSC